jgi:hypothetical protein
MSKGRGGNSDQVLLPNFASALQSGFSPRSANQGQITAQTIGAQTHAQLSGKFAGLIWNGHICQSFAGSHNAAPHAVVFFFPLFGKGLWVLLESVSALHHFHSLCKCVGCFDFY